MKCNLYCPSVSPRRSSNIPSSFMPQKSLTPLSCEPLFWSADFALLPLVVGCGYLLYTSELCYDFCVCVQTWSAVFLTFCLLFFQTLVQSFGISTDSLSLEGQAECAVLCSAAVQCFRRECFRTTVFVVKRAVKAYCSTEGKLNSQLQVFSVTLEKLSA